MNESIIYLLTRIESSGIVRLIPDKTYIGLNYFLRTGKRIHWNNPRTYNEKINWMKIYDRNPMYVTLVDKQAVKEWAADKLGEGHIIPTLGVWDDFENIDFDILPEQFVLKTTHDSGGVVIYTGEKELDRDKLNKFFKRRLNRNYYWHGRQWAYKGVKPRIMAEPYMVDESGVELKDYKVFCFDGEPRMIHVDFGRFDNHQRNLYTTKWEYIPASIKYPTNPDRVIEKPEALDELLRCAKVLSEGMRHARADFYIIGTHVYLGEMTLYHGDGCEKFTPESFGYEMGDWMKIS